MSWAMKSRSTRYCIARRTSGIENGLSSPSGAGAGLRISERLVAGALMSSIALGALELLRGLGLEPVQVHVHVAGLDVEGRAIDENA